MRRSAAWGGPRRYGGTAPSRAVDKSRSGERESRHCRVSMTPAATLTPELGANSVKMCLPQSNVVREPSPTVATLMAHWRAPVDVTDWTASCIALATPCAVWSSTSGPQLLLTNESWSSLKLTMPRLWYGGPPRSITFQFPGALSKCLTV